MQVAYFTRLRHIELHDGPPPVIDQSGHALVRIDRLGVRGSDVHSYAEGGIGAQRIAFKSRQVFAAAATYTALQFNQPMAARSLPPPWGSRRAAAG